MQERRQVDVQIGMLIQSVENIHEKIDAQYAQLKIIDSRLGVLERDYAMFKSFFGGVVFVLSAIWAFITFAWGRLNEMLTRFLGSSG